MNRSMIRREELGLTRAEVAGVLGVSVSAVSAWERGESIPRLKLQHRLADLYGMSWHDLFGRVG